MKKGLIGRKIGMTQVFDEKGNVIPVTVVELGPCAVVQKKTVENDGYNAVQLGFEDKKVTKTNKPMAGHFKKADVAPKKFLREFRLEDDSAINVGDIIKADIFAAGEKVDVSGQSKGHGFSGNVQRWNAHMQEMTHGVGPVHRSPGSLGANSTPSRVFKNHKLPGHWGFEKVTIQNLEIAKVDADRNLILIKGAIPGAKGSVVTICSAVKA